MTIDCALERTVRKNQVALSRPIAAAQKTERELKRKLKDSLLSAAI